MKSYQLEYDNSNSFIRNLKEIKDECEYLSHANVIFYLVWNFAGGDDVVSATKCIEQIFPDALYYGNEASGNIIDGNLSYGITVTCYVFEKAGSKTELLWVEENGELANLEELWDYCKSRKGLKAIELIPSIAYLDILQIENNVPDISDDVLIFGGASVNYDNPTYDADIIAKGHEMTSLGMAVVLYYGSELHVETADVLGWKGLGPLMTVTRSHDKIIDELNGYSAMSVYQKYLNVDEGENVGTVFPLIVEEDGIEYIRSPQTFLPDGSMRMFATIPQGSQACIAYGDKNTILNKICEKAYDIADFVPQAIKVYSCAARKIFWGDEEIHKETIILQDIAPVSGFYTGGEILRFGSKIKVLNCTLAMVCFREGRKGAKKQNLVFDDNREDKSTLSRITFFAEKVVEEQENQRKLVEGLENAFASQYQVVYYINLAKGETTLLHGDINAKKYMNIFNATSVDEMIKNFHRFYVDVAVAVEDRDKVKSVMNTENILETLKTSNSISVNFKVRRNLIDPIYTEMRIIKAAEKDGNLTDVIMGFKLSDEDLKEALEQNEKLRGDVMNEMLGDDGVFLIDCMKDSRRTIHDNCNGASQYSDEEPYSKTIEFYVNNFVAEADRAKMREATETSYMLRRLKREKEYKVEYRDNTTGVLRYYQMRVARFSDTEVLQSFADKDKEIVDRMMLERMEEDYFALIAINLDAEFVQVMKKSPVHPMGEVGEVAPYSQTIKQFAKRCEGDARDFFERISDIEFLKQRLEAEDKITFSYKSSEKRWITVTGFVIERDSEKNPILFVLGFTYTDSMESEKLELRNQLNDALKSAEVANKSKTNFLFNMSHDIRTPMNAIKGFTAMAKKYSDDRERVTDYLDKIDISSQQLLTLINQVLEMSRIESGTVEFNYKPVNMLEKFESLVTVFSAQADVNGLVFKHGLHDLKHVYVLADEARMEQITLNIVGNAIKYTPEGGTIEFELKEIPCDREGYARYVNTISDNGIGMSKEYLKDLYEPFSREKNSTVGKIQGTGLGMSIVKTLVDLMGGKIEVKSLLGKGSRFEITLDLEIAGESVRQITNYREISNISFKGDRVLLVEDNEMNREIAKDILEEHGFVVEEAEDGDIAIDMIKDIVNRGDKRYYDLILMDIQMPRVNGYEATKEIRAILNEQENHLPIIAMTANAFEEDRQNALIAGMDEHIAKPIEINKLIETLARFIPKDNDGKKF